MAVAKESLQVGIFPTTGSLGDTGEAAAAQFAVNGAAWRAHVAPPSRLVSKMPHGQVRPGAADAA